jgi:hypothetical protein
VNKGFGKIKQRHKKPANHRAIRMDRASVSEHSLGALRLWQS